MFHKYTIFSILPKCLRELDLAPGAKFGDPLLMYQYITLTGSNISDAGVIANIACDRY